MSISKKQGAPDQEGWKTDNTELIVRVRNMRPAAVLEVLKAHKSVAKFANLGACATPSAYYNRLMVCLLDGRIPESALPG